MDIFDALSLTATVHFSPQEYFDFLKENLVAHCGAQSLAKVPQTFSLLPSLFQSASYMRHHIELTISPQTT